MTNKKTETSVSKSGKQISDKALQNGINQEKKKMLITNLTLTMPDGSIEKVDVNKEESFEKKRKCLIDNWYKVTKDDPKKFSHFDIKDKCPKCGGSLRCNLLNKQSFIWCLNSECGFHDIEAKDNVRLRLYEKYGLKVEWVHKTGACIIMTNNNVKKDI